MVHIYYHIYAIDGVESIIDEQLSLIFVLSNKDKTFLVDVFLPAIEIPIFKLYSKLNLLLSKSNCSLTMDSTPSIAYM